MTTILRIACLLTALLTSAAGAALPLWEIEGTANRIRLLGSVHFLRAGDYPLPAAIEEAYRQADVIVMELDLNAIRPTDLQRVQQELAVDPRGRNLREIVGATAWRRATGLAQTIDIDLAMLQPFEPWFAALQITQLRLLQLGFDGSFGVDLQISRQARVDGKPVRGLETLDEQLGALDALTATAQQRFFVQTLEDAAALEDELTEIVTAWRNGDIGALNTLLLDGLADQPEVYDRILVRRNRRWTRAIIDMTDDARDYLVIVGTLHLIGEDSVQRMLGESGIRTRQLH